ncbi:MAG: hypothetical protein HYW05_04365 [Candidatus Diapherotrites archaeon]|nr:hypothetical protein [Candidatus Diapherotrites archaeon]
MKDNFLLGIIGPSDSGKNAQILGHSLEGSAAQIREIARSAAEIGIKRIAIVPHKGSASEMFAKEFGKREKVIGVVPLRDREFGISYLNKGVCDEIVDCGTWRNSAIKMNEICDAFLCLGFTCGALNEVAFSKWFNKSKKRKKKILVCAWRISSKLPKEIEKDVDLVYAGSLAQLRQRLKGLV